VPSKADQTNADQVSSFRPKNGLQLSDVTLDNDFENGEFVNCVWKNVGARDVKITGTSFRYGIFESCYFHAVKFQDCDFTGARFIRCSFPRSSFFSCDLQYAFFELTDVPRAAVLNNVPSRPNVARDLFRNLRANALQLGNTEDANAYIDEELRANSEFLRRALFNMEEYYREKYPFWPYKPKLFFKYLANAAGRLFWGHGESFVRLVIATLIVALGIGLTDWLLNPGLGDATAPFVSSLSKHEFHSLDVLLDLHIIAQTDVSPTARLFLTLLRYVALGLGFSILFRRNSYR
jgi:hypothetical protein